MAEPDLEFWRNREKYTLREAAFLCCNLEPEYGPYPPKVAALERELRGNVPFTVTDRTERKVRTGYIAQALRPEERITERKVPGEIYLELEDLHTWAKGTGRSFPFLDVVSQEDGAGEEAPRPRLVPMVEPARKDDWFHVLEAAVSDFEDEHGFTPNEFQLWQWLGSSPPTGYILETKGGQLILQDSTAGPMDRTAFNRRYARLFRDISRDDKGQ